MDQETIIAALLHDVLEDTGTSESEMQKEFGRNVVALGRRRNKDFNCQGKKQEYSGN